MESNQVQAKVIVEIQNCDMQKLVNQQRLPFTNGTVRIGQLEREHNQKVYFINLNSYYYTINKDVIFIKITYEKSITYLYPHFQNAFTALSVLKNDVNISKLQETLRNTSGLIQYAQALQNPILKQKLQQHCENIDKTPLIAVDKIEKIITTGGVIAEKTFKWLGTIVNSGVSYLGEYLDKKIQNKNEIVLKPQTKQKLNQIKEGSGKILKVSAQYLTTILTPVVAKGKQYTENLNTKIQNSNNQNVKYLKEIGITATGALTQAFNGLYVAATEVGSNIGKTTVNLWQKKYGNDVPNTLFHPETRPTTQLNEPHQNINQSIEVDKKVNIESTSIETSKETELYPNLDKK